MLEAGDRIPDVRVWTTLGEDAQPLRNALGKGLTLLCIYVYDWSPTWTDELHLLRDRGEDLAAARIRPFGLSRDSLWSHRAWAEMLGVDIPLLTDWEGEVIRGFGVEREVSGMTSVPTRSAFLIENGETIVAAWMLGPDLPDIDAVVAAARASR